MCIHLNDFSRPATCKFVQIVHAGRMEDPITTTEAARIAAVGPSTIKRWANDGVLLATKTLGGHRRFSRGSLMRFLEERTVRPILDDEEDAQLAQALLSGNRYLVDARLLLLRAKTKSWSEVAQLLGGLLTKIGQAWRAGELTIFQEHMMSEALSRAVSRIGDSFPSTPNAPRCGLACAPLEKHTLGLRLAELCVREVGWTTRWLGANTPPEEIVRVVQEDQLDWLIIAGSEICDEISLASLAFQLESVCRLHSTQLVLGGNAKWPTQLAWGHRLTDYTELSLLLKKVP
jgi:MerR family transcriptional regulator, light-induced transcriptional regulator